MRPSVTCYVTPGKPKARLLLDAFASGAAACDVDARVVTDIPRLLRPGAGAVAFYGVTADTVHLWHQAREEGRDWYYLDNAYFDRGRGDYYRVTRNRLQADGRGPGDVTRLMALGVTVRAWRHTGSEVLAVCQSDAYLRTVCDWRDGESGWMRHVGNALARFSSRPVRFRPWNRDKAEAGRTFRQDLDRAWAVVTHTSAAANEALLAGVPAFVTGPCAALWMSGGDLEHVDNPRRPSGRGEWAAALAAAQWTLDEIRAGAAWRALASEHDREAAHA